MPDGLRIDDCFRNLRDLLADLPAIATDAWIIDNRLWAVPEPSGGGIAANLKRRAEIEAIAEVVIRRAVQAGRLDLWIMTHNGLEKVDHHEARAIQHQTLTAGRYIPLEGSPSSLDDRPLWALRSDWEAFRQRLMKDRGVIDLEEVGASIKAANRAIPRIGRPVGTGFQDRKFVAEAFELLKNGGAKSANEAARIIVVQHGDKIGGANFDAKQTRIRKAVMKLEGNGQ